MITSVTAHGLNCHGGGCSKMPCSLRQDQKYGLGIAGSICGLNWVWKGPSCVVGELATSSSFTPPLCALRLVS